MKNEPLRARRTRRKTKENLCALRGPTGVKPGRMLHLPWRVAQVLGASSFDEKG